MMKKLALITLCLALLLCCAACADVSLPTQTSVPETAAPAPSSAPEAAAPAAEPSPEAEAPIGEAPAAPDMAIRFSTTTLDGAPADESILAGHTLTMVNFFEPWCPPCVAELPELQKLYETYESAGFQIIGVFSTEEGVEAVLEDAGVSYPVLRYVPVFDQFQTGYVPTTVFLDAQGNVVGKTQIGSNSYAGWEAIVKELLG